MPYLILFWRLIGRPLRKEPLRTLLTALAVALGVSVVLAIELAGNAAAGRSGRPWRRSPVTPISK
jgi:hypothetical protein